jgi:ribosomal protein S18 acetylase RimI-like enzyme
VLPDGFATEGTWLLAVEADGVGRVGVIWIGPHQQRADAVFLYDIEIDEAHRGKGYGRAALLAAEQILVDAGVREIGLNVFGFNDGARRLYESLGYRTLSVQMSKPLG